MTLGIDHLKDADRPRAREEHGREVGPDRDPPVDMARCAERQLDRHAVTSLSPAPGAGAPAALSLGSAQYRLEEGTDRRVQLIQRAPHEFIRFRHGRMGGFPGSRRAGDLRRQGVRASKVEGRVERRPQRLVADLARRRQQCEAGQTYRDVPRPNTLRRAPSAHSSPTRPGIERTKVPGLRTPSQLTGHQAVFPIRPIRLPRSASRGRSLKRASDSLLPTRTPIDSA